MVKLTSCPWVTRPTHSRNGEIMVDQAVPLTYGYCSQDIDCAYCAGTGYKPNILLQLGRPFTTVPCPYCFPDKYRKAVSRLRGSVGTPAAAGTATDSDSELDDV
ncbi:MAG: hypothetical protein JXR83_14835 [Deltaproteobacteria bacterium]|nr:hypothetical protein [Deltaproteobacteria bacterium]